MLEMGNQAKFAAPYMHHAIGMTELKNRHVQDYLQIYTQGIKQWADALVGCEFALNNAFNATLGCSSIFVSYGFNSRFGPFLEKDDVFLETSPVEACEWIERLKQAYRSIQKNGEAS